MKIKKIVLVIFGLYLLNFSLVFAADERKLTSDEYSEKIITLNWKFSEQEDGETIQIKNTNASVILVKDGKRVNYSGRITESNLQEFVESECKN